MLVAKTTIDYGARHRPNPINRLDFGGGVHPKIGLRCGLYKGLSQ